MKPPFKTPQWERDEMKQRHGMSEKDHDQIWPPRQYTTEEKMRAERDVEDVIASGMQSATFAPDGLTPPF